MSWSRDFFEEVRKFDPSVAAHLGTLGFSASEKMLIGSIIFFGTYAGAESIRSFKHLINSARRLNEDERLRLFVKLINPPSDVLANIDNQPHEDRVKKLLGVMFKNFGSVPATYKRVLAVRFMLKTSYYGH